MRKLREGWRAPLLALSVFLVVASAWFYFAGHPFSGPGRYVDITVRPGEAFDQLVGDLQSHGVVSSGFALKLDAAVFGAPSIHPGTFSIRTSSSFGEVRQVFGGQPDVVISVRRGITLLEIQQALATKVSTAFANGWAAATVREARVSPFHPNGQLEGLVGLGTYVITAGEAPRRLVDEMTKSFAREARQVGITPSTTLHGLSAYQLIIAASIVEKEGYYRMNMSRVARVILNRLARGGGLQMDATVLYYFHQDGGTVTPGMLQTVTPYNTYLHAGLTPTPICQPSRYALRAMVHPANGSWLYFTLVKRDGTMKFSTTFAQQLAAEQLAASRGI